MHSDRSRMTGDTWAAEVQMQADGLSSTQWRRPTYGHARGENSVRGLWRPRHRIDESRVTSAPASTQGSQRTRMRAAQRQREHACYVSVKETLRQLTDSTYCRWLCGHGERSTQSTLRSRGQRSRASLHEYIQRFGTPDHVQEPVKAVCAPHHEGKLPIATSPRDGGSVVTSCLDPRSSSFMEDCQQTDVQHHPHSTAAATASSLLTSVPASTTTTPLWPIGKNDDPVMPWLDNEASAASPLGRAAPAAAEEPLSSTAASVRAETAFHALKGRRVELHGLKTVERNGCTGTVQGCDETRDRLQVRSTDGRLLLVRASNVRILADPAPVIGPVAPSDGGRHQALASWTPPLESCTLCDELVNEMSSSLWDKTARCLTIGELAAVSTQCEQLLRDAYARWILTRRAGMQASAAHVTHDEDGRLGRLQKQAHALLTSVDDRRKRNSAAPGHEVPFWKDVSGCLLGSIHCAQHDIRSKQ